MQTFRNPTLGTLHFGSQRLLSKHAFFLNSVIKVNSVIRCTDFAPKSPFLHSPSSVSYQAQIPKPVLCARKKKKRNGSQRLAKAILKSISVIASNLEILPLPLDLVVKEFGGGNGGKTGFLKSFGGRFDGWGRGRNRHLGFLAFLVACALGLLIGGEIKSDAAFTVSGLGLLGASLIKEWKRGVKDLVVGFCFFGVLIGLGIKRGEVTKWMDEIRVCSPMVDRVKRRKRRVRRAL